MSDVTGTLHHSFGGKTYSLRLTLGGIAKLQAVHGLDLGGMLTQTEESAQDRIPDFSIMIAILQVALERGGVAPELSGDLADDMLTEDVGLAVRVMQAAFPKSQASREGKARAPKAKA